MMSDPVTMSATTFAAFVAEGDAHHPDLANFSPDDTVLVLDFTKNGTVENELGTFNLVLDPSLAAIEEVVWSSSPQSSETLIAPGDNIQLPSGAEAVFSDNKFDLFAGPDDQNNSLLDIKLDDFGLTVNGEELGRQFIEELTEIPNSHWSPDNSILTMRQDQTYMDFMSFLNEVPDATSTELSGGHESAVNMAAENHELAADGSLPIDSDISHEDAHPFEVDASAVASAVDESAVADDEAPTESPPDDPST